MPRSKAPAWTSQEIAILQDIYPREGMSGAPDRVQKPIALEYESGAVQPTGTLFLEGPRR